MERRTKFNVFYVLFAVLAMLAVQEGWRRAQTIEVVPYSEFERYLEEDRISEVTVSDQHITGKLRKPEGSKTVVIANLVPPELADRLSRYDIKYTRVQESTLLRDMLSWVLPALVFFGIWYLLARRMSQGGGLGGGFMSIGKSRAKIYVEAKTGVTFADVAGVDEAKAELQEVVEFLRDPKKYGRLGARVPKGVLLVGPPGTGKTLLARAVAGEAKVPFFSISGSEFVEMIVGVGASRVRDLFTQAEAIAPCIVFIDELDALGKARGATPLMGGHDEREQTLNQLLVEMDGFDSRKGVCILSATNRPEILDPALLRPGRFDRQVLVDRPDLNGREEILRLHARKVRLSPNVELRTIAARTPGFVGADLANITNKAALLAAREDKEAIEMADLEEAIERIIAGLEKKNRLLSKQEQRIVAYHEAGHALVAASSPHADPVHRISIIPRGIAALGYTLQLPTEDRYLVTRAELLDKLAVLFGGRAAEELIFQEISTGGHNDLQRAADIARRMVVEYGMSAKFGPLAFDPKHGPVFLDGTASGAKEYSEETARDIDEEVARITRETYTRVQEILARRRNDLERLAQRLLETEVLEGEELKQLLSGAISALQPAPAATATA